MTSLLASAERRDEEAAPGIARVDPISGTRLRPGRVLAGIALVALCAVLFCVAVLYVSTPASGPDLWSLAAAIRRGFSS